MTIYLQNEFDSDLPLWRTDGCHGRTALCDGEISRDLCARVQCWSAFFHENYSWERGWQSESDEQGHRVEGQKLLLLLREELGDDRIELRLWECAPTVARVP